MNGTSYRKNKRLFQLRKGPGHFAVDCMNAPKSSKIKNSTDALIQIYSRISRERIKTRKKTMGNRIRSPIDTAVQFRYLEDVKESSKSRNPERHCDCGLGEKKSKGKGVPTKD
ncbi:hypothetical protein TNIN_169421 [Trichonephila inaurata madagascariensis]|uniref:Uncharacterized protein n=1 Tax=Trichonephila inaurata madagascariensis TaxID=2747483 RepID=A0A8X6YYZ9_9ARAC|nr:hypothetical protein TNIN_169421 [Trichonephila inaurata madagascariensis]